MTKIILMIFFTIVAMCILLNISYVQLAYEKLSNKRKIAVRVLLVTVISILILCEYLENKSDKDMEQEIKREQETLEEYSKEESSFYNMTINKNYEKQNQQEPYIPEDFKYVDGNWNDGFVIQDNNENQYVWVPCTNKADNEYTLLNKYNFDKNPWISTNECYDTEYKEFLKSALNYGGFYIARYEVCRDKEEKPIIKENSAIWTNINEKEIEQIVNIIKSQYDSDIEVQLINSYAYDTTIKWIEEKNTIEFYKKSERYSGTKEYNNIYDLFDTILEITTEKFCDEKNIYRGNCGEILQIKNKKETRISLINSQLENVTMRMILYKK